MRSNARLDAGLLGLVPKNALALRDRGAMSLVWANFLNVFRQLLRVQSVSRQFRFFTC